MLAAKRNPPPIHTHTHIENPTHTFPVTVWFTGTSAECPAFLLDGREAEYVRPGTRLTSCHPSSFLSPSKRHSMFEVRRLVWVEKYLCTRETTVIYRRVRKKGLRHSNDLQVKITLGSSTEKQTGECKAVCTPWLRNLRTHARWMYFQQDCKIRTKHFFRVCVCVGCQRKSSKLQIKVGSFRDGELIT